MMSNLNNPNRSKYQDRSVKRDAGKPRLHLVPTRIIRDIAEVREYGNRKYGESESWRRAEPIRYVDALLRHTLSFVENPHGVDAESGIPHYKHMACNLAFLCELLGEEADDFENLSRHAPNHTQKGADPHESNPE